MSDAALRNAERAWRADGGRAAQDAYLFELERVEGYYPLVRVRKVITLDPIVLRAVLPTEFVVVNFTVKPQELNDD